MAERKNRDQLVLATKYTTCYVGGRNDLRFKTNYAGNSSKSMRLSVEDSLKKLQTDYIDLLYLHWWDFSTGVEEVMQSLNQLVQAGKVLYLGVSDTPAWVVSKANECKFNLLPPFHDRQYYLIMTTPLKINNLFPTLKLTTCCEKMPATTASAASASTKAATTPQTATSNATSSP